MPTRAAEGNGGGVGEAAKRVADHAKALAGLEVELAAHEMKRKAGALGVGVGMLVGAAVVGVFALGFLLATLAAVLAIFLDLWLALLLTALGLLAIAGVLAAIGLSGVRKGSPPVPEQAIDEAKRTTEAIRA